MRSPKVPRKPKPLTASQQRLQDLKDKLDRAWRMVSYLGHGNSPRAWLFSIPEITEETGVDTPTVAAMRARYMDLREAGREPTGDWWTDARVSVLPPAQRP